MKKNILSLIAFALFFHAIPAKAADLMIAASMQRCATNEECTLVTNSCTENCGFVPVNKANMNLLASEYQSRCGKMMEANPVCNMTPPITAACVNSRCTIGYAYVNHAGAADYKSGAYPVAEQPSPSKVRGDYSKIDDRHGFTAYDLPKEEIKQNNMGTLNSTVYVPPAAPVSGGNYVPVAPSAMPQQQPAPTTPPAASVPTPVMPAPANVPAAATSQQQLPEPAPLPPAAPTPAYEPIAPQSEGLAIPPDSKLKTPAKKSFGVSPEKKTDIIKMN